MMRGKNNNMDQIPFAQDPQPSQSPESSQSSGNWNWPWNRNNADRRPLNRADRRERRFLIAFICVAIAAVLTWMVVVGVKVGFGKENERTNPEQAGTPRVYDYADMLTAKQEDALEERIAKAEEIIRADIVIVIINESLEEKYPDLTYLRSNETDAYEGIRRYAESYWDDNGFGWNKPGDEGNGIIMVDNIYRESNGYVYNWVAGSGDLRYTVGNTACEKLSQDFTDRLPMGDMPQFSEDYADALMAFVADCVETGGKIHRILSWSAFTPSGVLAAMTSGVIAFIAGAVIFAVLLGRMIWQMNYSGKQRKNKKKAGSASGCAWIAVWLAIILLCGIAPNVGVWVFAGLIVLSILSNVMPRNNGAKKDPGKDAPFRTKEPLEPDQFYVTNSQNQYLGSYFTSSSSGGGGGRSGGGGGGGHSGGGGGHSGGGSHR